MQQPSAGDRIGTTFGEVYELYMETYARPFTKSWQNTEEYWNRYCLVWKDLPIEGTSRLDIQRWVAALGVSKGKPTANRAFTVLAAAVNWADRYDYIRLVRNPCKGIRTFRAEYRERFLQPDEFERFFNALEAIRTDMREVFWLCLLTAARKSNVLAMRWEDISLSAKYWRVPAEQSKSNEALLIPLTPKAVEMLSARLVRFGDQSPWVFPGRGKSGHLRWTKNAWRRLLKIADLSERLTVHDLRRTVGSYLAINGANPYVIGAALGHKDPRSTAIYARLNLKPVRDAVESLQSAWIEPRDGPLT